MNQSQILNSDLKCLRYTIKNLTIALFTLLNCVGCSGQVKQDKRTQTKSNITTEISKISENGDRITLNQYKDGKKYGLWRDFHENGQMKSEGSYIAGLREGLHKEWEDDGILILEGFYVKGKANGLMKWFHERGHLAGEGNMIDDIRDGPWKICDIQENGFCIEANFKNGKRDGIWKIYHENARNKLRKEQTFKDDKMMSEKCWDESGKAIECE